MADMKASLKLELVHQLREQARSARAALAGVGKSADELKKRTEALNKIRKQAGTARDDIGQYRKLKTALGETAQAMAVQQQKTREAALAYQALKKDTTASAKALSASKRQFDNARTASAKLKKAHNEQSQALERMRRKLRANDISTRDLSGSMGRLAQRQREATRAANAEAEALEKVRRKTDAVARARNKLKDAGIKGAAATGAGYVGVHASRKMAGAVMPLVGEAVRQESAFTDVRKVLDFKDAAEKKAFKRRIAVQSRDLPLNQEGLYSIASEGARGEVPKAELNQFVDTVAKSAVAWEVDPGRAGETLAKLRKSWKKSTADLVAMSDVINHLDNNSSAKAREILEVLRRTSGMAGQYGLTFDQTAALSSTLMSLDLKQEVAATGMNALMLKTRTATQQSKKFRDALYEINMLPQQLEKDILANPQAGLMKLLESIEKLPKSRRMNVLGGLAGAEYSDDLAILLENMNEYRRQLKLVADAQNYAGSAQKEFDNRAEDTDYQWQLVRNRLAEVRGVLGESLLPAIKEVIAIVKPHISQVADWARENQTLVRNMLLGGLAIAGVVGAVGGLMLTVGPLIIGLRAAGWVMATLGFRSGLLKTSLKALAAPFKWLWRGSAWLARGLGSVIAPALQLGRNALPYIGRAAAWLGPRLLALAGPVGWAVGALTTGAWAVYENWNQLKTWWGSWTLKDVGYQVGYTLANAAASVQERWNSLKSWWDSFSLRDIVVKIGAAAMDELVFKAIRLGRWWRNFSLADKAAEIGTEAFDWAYQKIKSFLAWWDSISLKSLIPDIKLPNISAAWTEIKAGFTAGWKDGGARAAGGPVRPGRFYQVNELGPELLNMAGKTYLMASHPGSIVPIRRPANDPDFSVRRTQQHSVRSPRAALAGAGMLAITALPAAAMTNTLPGFDPAVQEVRQQLKAQQTPSYEQQKINMPQQPVPPLPAMGKVHVPGNQTINISITVEAATNPADTGRSVAREVERVIRNLQHEQEERARSAMYDGVD